MSVFGDRPAAAIAMSMRGSPRLIEKSDAASFRRAPCLRVAISWRRITAFDGCTVTSRVEDYRGDGAFRHCTLTLEAGETIRRFLLHILPHAFHRIRHYGFLTGPKRNAYPIEED